jgi:PEP-CTERM motif
VNSKGFIAVADVLGNVGTGEAGGTGTIVGTPEPSTWAMMLLGFAGLGFAGYRKARGARAALSAA